MAQSQLINKFPWIKNFEKDWAAEKLFKSILNNKINNIMCKRNKGLMLMGGNGRQESKAVYYIKVIYYKYNPR